MKRRPRTHWAITAALIAGTLIGLSLAPFVRAAGRGQLAPAGFGLRMELATIANTKALLNAAQVMRADWIAQDVKWKDIEPEPGQYQWEALDTVVLATRPYGIRLMFSVAGTPNWARPANADLNFDGPPADYALFANFLTALSTRYTGVIGAYEIWPEANLRSRWWTAEGVSAAAYAEFLRVSAAAVKQGDPFAIVISGGLAPTGAYDGLNVIDDLTFYQQLYAAGGMQYVDGLGVRVDGYNNPPADTPQYSSVATTTYKGHTSFYFRHYEDVRVIMVANGDEQKGLWITSAGWASSSAVIEGMEYAADVSEAQQARYLVEALVQAQAQPYVAAVFVNNFNLATVPTTPPHLAPYSLLRPDWSARPAFGTLAQVRQGDAFTAPQPAASLTEPSHVIPNWKPRLRYQFGSPGQ